MKVRSLHLLVATIILEHYMMISLITQYFWYLLCQSWSLNGPQFDDLHGLLISCSHLPITIQAWHACPLSTVLVTDMMYVLGMSDQKVFVRHLAPSIGFVLLWKNKLV